MTEPATVLYLDMWVGERIQETKLAGLPRLLSRLNPVGVIVECSASHTDLPPRLFGRVPVVYLNCRRSLYGPHAVRIVHDHKQTVRAAFREIVGNRIHDVWCYGQAGRGGRGIYTDEGSAHILIASNLVYNISSGQITQHYGKENRFVNNIFAFSRGRGEMIYHARVEKHHSFDFDHNIVVWEGAREAVHSWDHYTAERSRTTATSGGATTATRRRTSSTISTTPRGGSSAPTRTGASPTRSSRTRAASTSTWRTTPRRGRSASCRGTGARPA